MKRILSIVLALALIMTVIGTLPFTVSAASMSDADFFAKFNYSANPSLSEVKSFVDAGDYEGAKAALLEYFKERKANSTISGFGVTEADEFYGMAVLPMRNILTGPYEFDMWQAEFTVTSADFAEYEVDVTSRVAGELNNGAVSFMLFAGDKQQYPVYVKSKEAGSDVAPKLVVEYDIDGTVSTAIITADNDTYISSGSTGSTYGTAAELVIKEDGTGSNSTGSNTRRTYLNFPLDKAANSTVLSAKIVVNAAYAADCTTGDKDVLVINVGDTMWSENSLTWAGTRGSIYSYQNADVPTWAANAPNADSEYHNVTSRFWFGKPMAYEYLSYLENPELYNETHPYSDVYPGEEFGPKLVQLMDAFATQRAYGYTRTLETGERLNRWVDIIDAFLETDVFDTRLDEFCNILSFMWGDCNYLAGLDIANGSYWWSNWRIVANAGFFKAVEYLPEFTTHDGWRNKVEYNVEYTFDLLYNDDYSFTEAGPSYSVWCVKLFGDCIRAAEMSGNPMNAVFIEKVKYATRNAVEGYYPNGYDTNIGDSNYKNQMPWFEMLNEVFGESDNVINSYVSGENKGAEYLTRYYHAVNTAYMRNSWDPDEAVYVNYTNNPADGHYHPDSNQIVMYAYGSPLLVDSGRYSYSSTNSIYDTLRTAASHNTIEAVGVSMGAHTAATTANSLIYANTNDTFDFAASEQRGYSGVSHIRNVFFARSGYAIVTDYVTGSASRTYRQNWHFMPSSNATVNGTTAKTDFYMAPDITVSAASATGAAIRNGYHSADYGLVAESQYASFEKVGSTVKFDTLLYPERADEEITAVAADLAANDNSKAAIKITVDGEDAYYYVRNTAASDGTFGDYKTDAKMAYVSDSEIMLTDGKAIEGKLESPNTVVSIGITNDNGAVIINGEKLIASTNAGTAIKIYAPATASVILNGKEVEFKQDGDYIYAVASAVEDSLTGLVTRVYPDKDGFVASSTGNEGPANPDIIQAARDWQNRNAYMAFDLSDFVDKEITNAVLNLKVTEAAKTPSNLHFYYLDYGTWTRDNLEFILDSSKMPTHTSTNGGFTGFSYRWQGNAANAVEGDWLRFNIAQLAEYLDVTDNYKFTWAILSESGSVKMNSVSAAEENRPYLELTYNYTVSGEDAPTVTINTYLDGELASSEAQKAKEGNIYLHNVADTIDVDSTTYYFDAERSNISTIIQKGDNVIDLYYESAVKIDITFTNLLGEEIAEPVVVAVSPFLSSYTYTANDVLVKDDIILTLDADASTLTVPAEEGSEIVAVYKSTYSISGENVMTNGSFENENGEFSLTGWNSAQTNAQFGDPYTTDHCYAVNESEVINKGVHTSLTTEIPDGNWAFASRWNDPTNGLCSLKRYVPVESGKTYYVSYDVKHATGADGGYLMTSLVANSGVAENEATRTTAGYIGTEWTTVGRMFTATDETDYVLFWFRWLGPDGNPGNGPYWFFDNFAIVEVEEIVTESGQLSAIKSDTLTSGTTSTTGFASASTDSQITVERAEEYKLGIVAFDATVPADSTITKATVKLHINDANTTTAPMIYLADTLKEWSKGNVTGFDLPAEAIATGVVESEYVTFDVSDYITETGEITFAIFTQADGEYFVFDSENTEYAPQLIIEAVDSDVKYFELVGEEVVYTSYDSENATVIIAYYDINDSVVKAVTNTGNGETVSVPIEKTVETAVRYKAFVFKSKDSLTPVMTPIEGTLN